MWLKLRQIFGSVLPRFFEASWSWQGIRSAAPSPRLSYPTGRRSQVCRMRIKQHESQAALTFHLESNWYSLGWVSASQIVVGSQSPPYVPELPSPVLDLHSVFHCGLPYEVQYA